MLRRRHKSDWFAVVATDLFCGVLAAVVILDAVAPKEVSAAGSETLLVMTYAATAKTCHPNDVVFQFQDASTTHNTIEGDLTTVAFVDGTCRVETFIPEVNLEGGIRDPIVLVTELRGDLSEADIEFTGGDASFKCRADGSEPCVIR